MLDHERQEETVELRAARLAYGAVSVRGALDALRPAITVPTRLEEQLGGSR